MMKMLPLFSLSPLCYSLLCNLIYLQRFMCGIRNTMKLIAKTINPTGSTHSASVIFLHGSGDTGPNVMEWIRFVLGRQMQFPHIKIIYPTAPLQPYTPMDGELSNVWFDRNEITIKSAENRKSMSEIYESIKEIISEEVKQNIPVERIIIGGFSMGGALALHTGYHLNTKLAGVFACSSFLNHNSIVYESLKEHHASSDKLPELRMFHGDRDTLVPLAWGQESFNNLLKLGVTGQFTPLRNTLHELKKQEMEDLEKWILEKLPPSDN